MLFSMNQSNNKPNLYLGTYINENHTILLFWRKVVSAH